MRYMQDKVIYEGFKYSDNGILISKTLVYINQCHNKGKKTKLFAIRRDDNTGLDHYLGSIEWDGAWRQFVFCPDPSQPTKWAPGCMQSILNFALEQTRLQRKKWKK